MAKENQPRKVESMLHAKIRKFNLQLEYRYLKAELKNNALGGWWEPQGSHVDHTPCDVG